MNVSEADAAQAIEDIKHYLGTITHSELQARIRTFRKLQFQVLSEEDIRKELHKVFLSKHPRDGKNWHTGISATSSWPKETDFFRVRKLDCEPSAPPYNKMAVASDLWHNPTPSACQSGRFNARGTSVLYLTPAHPGVAAQELQISRGDFFALIVYRPREKIDCLNIAHLPEQYRRSFSDDEWLKLNTLNDFVVHECTRHVGVGTEYLYKISRVLFEMNLNIDLVSSHGWGVLYPSVPNQNALNIVFPNPELAKQKLHFRGVATMLYDGGEKFLCQSVSRKLDDDEKLLFERPTEESVTDLLPDDYQGFTPYWPA